MSCTRNEYDFFICSVYLNIWIFYDGIWSYISANSYFFFYIWATSWQNQQCGCAPSEDSDQPGHMPSLIRVFAVRMRKAWVLSYPLSGQRRLWSDWADAEADLSLRWGHMPFCWFCHAVAQIAFFFVYILPHTEFSSAVLNFTIILILI